MDNCGRGRRIWAISELSVQLPEILVFSVRGVAISGAELRLLLYTWLGS